MNALPTVIDRRIGSQYAEIEMIVDTDGRWFDGHFPGHPILPGVVQIAWAVHFATELYPFNADVRVLERIKFKRAILPRAQITLRLTPVANTSKMHFDYRAGDTSLSSGTLGAAR